MASREQDVFVIADEALAGVVDRIGDEQWGMPMPDWFQTGRVEGVTLRMIIGYHAYDDAWVPDTLAGQTIEEVGDRYAGDLLGDEPKASFRAIGHKAIAAVEGLSDADLDRAVHLTYGDFPAREYLTHIISFRGFRVFDIAKAIGADTTMPAGLVDGLFDLIVPNLDQWRAIGVVPPALPAPAGADRQTELLCLVGREATAGRS